MVFDLNRQYPGTVSQRRVFKELSDRVYANNVRVGFRDNPDHPDASFGEAMALLTSEAMEALDAYRTAGFNDISDTATGKPEGVGSELADVFIRLLDTCQQWNINLLEETLRKMAYNETRPYRHGNKRL